MNGTTRKLEIEPHPNQKITSEPGKPCNPLVGGTDPNYHCPKIGLTKPPKRPRHMTECGEGKTAMP